MHEDGRSGQLGDRRADAVLALLAWGATLGSGHAAAVACPAGDRLPAQDGHGPAAAPHPAAAEHARAGRIANPVGLVPCRELEQRVQHADVVVDRGLIVARRRMQHVVGDFLLGERAVARMTASASIAVTTSAAKRARYACSTSATAASAAP